MTAKGKGKKKKGASGGKDAQQSKAPRTFTSRRSKGSTLKRLEVRRQTHCNQAARKQEKLGRRIEGLKKLLGHDGEIYEGAREHLSLGKLHRRLRRKARRVGCVGKSIRQWRPEGAKQGGPGASKEDAKDLVKELLVAASISEDDFTK